MRYFTIGLELKWKYVYSSDEGDEHMNLAQIRKTKQLKTVAIAAQIGVSQGHYSNLERSRKPITTEMLTKIAKALGEPVEIVQHAIAEQPVQSHKLNSWVSNIRINGLPLTRAFAYYLESKGIVADTLGDDVKMKLELKSFIESNISYSVVAEMTENKTLIPNLKMHIAKKDEVTKEQTDYEQFTGTK